MARDQEKLLAELVERLQKAYGPKLISVVLFGSAAVGDRTEKFSDLNVLCVLTELGLEELAAGEGVLRWWRELGNPSPLLLSEEEVRTSTDCFPIEFHDIKQRRRILYGSDPVQNLQIDESFYRAQVEYQLRAKLLRLRQKAALVLSDSQLLLDLMADSVSTFCALIRHALRLAGQPAPWAKREIVEQAAASFGLDPAPFLQLLDYRDNRLKPRQVKPRELLKDYLHAIDKVVSAVDKLEK